jgi:hypothetical protein
LKNATFDIILSEYHHANVAQLVEHSHGKGEVIGSIPIIGSERSEEAMKNANYFAFVRD